MRAIRVVIGGTYGRVVVESRVASDAAGRSAWRCRCSCGRSFITSGRSLVAGGPQGPRCGVPHARQRLTSEQVLASLTEAAMRRFRAFFSEGGRYDCWPWTGRISAAGYGICTIRRQKLLAHRVALVLAGTTPLPSQCVLHSCDCPHCVNPIHLRVGSHADNSRDRVARKRVPNRKLSEGSVAAARLANADGRSIRSLAKQHSVSWPVMWNAVRGVTWKHVTCATTQEGVTNGP